MCKLWRQVPCGGRRNGAHGHHTWSPAASALNGSYRRHTLLEALCLCFLKVSPSSCSCPWLAVVIPAGWTLMPWEPYAKLSAAFCKMTWSSCFITAMKSNSHTLQSTCVSHGVTAQPMFLLRLHCLQHADRRWGEWQPHPRH